MRKNTLIDWHGRVEKAILKIMESLDSPLDYKEISQEVYSSPYHFHRKFRELTGESVHKCIKRLRLERAMYKLRNTDESITDIALDSGYETLESFLKAFKYEYGIRPSAARQLTNWYGLIYSKAGLHYHERKNSHWFYLSSKGDDSVETKIINFKQKRVMGIQNIGDYWGQPKAWEKLNETISKNNLYSFPKEYIGVFPDHDEKIPIPQKRSYAAVVVDIDFNNTFGFKEPSIPEGLYAVTVHYGSPEEIGPTWDRWLKEWLPDSGWQVDVSRPMYEWYQNQTDLPELMLTFLCTLVIKG